MARGSVAAVAVRDGAVVQFSDVLVAARRVFLSGCRLEMGALAARVGIGRATLYRWASSREQLLAEVIWSMAQATIAQADESAQGEPGADRLADVVQGYFEAVAGNVQLHDFIEREPELAKRILLSVQSDVHTRAVAAIQAIIEKEQARASVKLALHPQLLAQALIRIGEAFLFADLAADAEPDSSTAVVISRQLLGATARRQAEQGRPRVLRPEHGRAAPSPIALATRGNGWKRANSLDRGPTSAD